MTPVEDDWFNCQKCGRAFYVATGAEYLAPRVCSLKCLADSLRESNTITDQLEQAHGKLASGVAGGVRPGAPGGGA